MFGIVKSTPAPDAGYRLLLDDLNRTKNDLDFAYANFQNVVEPDLIDAYIYEVNAMQLKYKFLLRRLKQKQRILMRRILWKYLTPENFHLIVLFHTSYPHIPAGYCALRVLRYPALRPRRMPDTNRSELFCMGNAVTALLIHTAHQLSSAIGIKRIKL